MARRRFTVDRYEEIERRLRAGRSLREIARALGCSRRTVREIRDGLRSAPGRMVASPQWTNQVDWTQAPAATQIPPLMATSKSPT